jgi:GNAT superfamily N-acetyltransferase
VLHEGSWTVHPICYLEDLFVDEKARGHGIGRALIADLLSLAKERGWGRLYWHTREGNAPARRLYDEFAVADDFVRYRIGLK